MGLQPGQASCGSCRLRPAADGGSGACPFERTLYVGYVKRDVHDCPRFIEGDFVPKAERDRRKRGEVPEQEALL